MPLKILGFVGSPLEPSRFGLSLGVAEAQAEQTKSVGTKSSKASGKKSATRGAKKAESKKLESKKVESEKIEPEKLESKKAATTRISANDGATKGDPAESKRSELKSSQLNRSQLSSVVPSANPSSPTGSAPVPTITLTPPSGTLTPPSGSGLGSSEVIEIPSPSPSQSLDQNHPSIALQPGLACHRAGSASAEVSHLLAADTGQILSVSKSGDICLWRGLKAAYLGAIPENFSVVALDPVSKKLAVAVGQQVSIMTVQDRVQDRVQEPSSDESSELRLETLSEIKRIGTGISALDFHPDGESLLLGGLDGKIYRWRLSGVEHGLLQTERTENLERYFGHSAVISALAMHSFGNIFLSGDWNGVLSIWALYDSDAAKGKFDNDLMPGKYFSDAADRIKVDRELTDEIIAIKLSLDGEIFALATAGGEIEVWKVRGVKKLASVRAHKGDIFGFDLDRSGHKLVSLGRDGALKRWELAPAKEGVKLANDAGNKSSLDRDKPAALTVQNGVTAPVDQSPVDQAPVDQAAQGGESLPFVLKLTSVNNDRGFSSAAFDVSGKVVVGNRAGQVLRQR